MATVMHLEKESLTKKESELRNSVFDSSMKLTPVLRIKPPEQENIQMTGIVLRIDEIKEMDKTDVEYFNKLKEIKEDLSGVIKQTKNGITKLMALETLANVERMTGDFRGLNKTLTQLEDIREKYEDYVEHGNVLMILKNFEKAKEKYVRASYSTKNLDEKSRCLVLGYIASLSHGSPDGNLLISALRESPRTTFSLFLTLQESFELPKDKTKIMKDNIIEIANKYSQFSSTLMDMVPVRV
ncbi:hypothetical protein KO465_01630 [Candidatus Micrarchaeota archaeon]|nr:hypothetical protein [Candidatus Micrarchaeota archaeon]